MARRPTDEDILTGIITDTQTPEQARRDTRRVQARAG